MPKSNMITDEVKTCPLIHLIGGKYVGGDLQARILALWTNLESPRIAESSLKDVIKVPITSSPLPLVQQDALSLAHPTPITTIFPMHLLFHSAHFRLPNHISQLPNLS